MIKICLYSCIVIFVSAFAACKNPKPSEVLEVSKFQFSDTTQPRLKSGFYLVTDNDSIQSVSKKIYDISVEKSNSREFIYSLSLKDVVLFENVDSIYSQKSNSEYEGLFDIILKLNPVAQKQLSELSSKTRYLSESEKYDGLMIGTVINNTLIKITHIHQQIDTNEIAISGGAFYKETVDDIIKYLEEGRTKK